MFIVLLNLVLCFVVLPGFDPYLSDDYGLPQFTAVSLCTVLKAMMDYDVMKHPNKSKFTCTSILLHQNASYTVAHTKNTRETDKKAVVMQSKDFFGMVVNSQKTNSQTSFSFFAFSFFFLPSWSVIPRVKFFHFSQVSHCTKCQQMPNVYICNCSDSS